MDKWDIFEKAPRPLLRWLCLFIAGWATVAPLDAMVRGLLLTFVASVYGIRGWEKLKGGEV